MTHSIIVREILSNNLAVRDNAAYLFQIVEDSPQDDIFIDFEGVDTMTRAFAHEYLGLKSKSNKSVQELNISTELERMLNSASHESPKGKRFPGLKTAEIIRI